MLRFFFRRGIEIESGQSDGWKTNVNDGREETSYVCGGADGLRSEIGQADDGIEASGRSTEKLNDSAIDA